MRLTRREWVGGLAAMGGLWGQTAKRLRRADCFFGLHFDLHPNKDDTVLGRDVTEDMVERLLERVRPDYVQYDCKGHAGYLGFVSQTGNSAKGIVQDSLAIWRRVTARRGVGLFVHFSGVWDSLAIEQHPEWARVDGAGKRDERQTSTFGPYVDRLMIPELEEAAAKYELDGAWVDGDCWQANPDYSDAAQKAFTAKTGIASLPRGPKDAGWAQFLEFNREQFRWYVRHYADALHKSRPGFQVASNWLYSTFVPERPELPVDFLSGDYLGAASISTAHLEARYLAATGKPWDLMAWGFFNPKEGGFQHKSAVQLQQEASVVIGQGGGFQIYYVPTRAGMIDDRHIEVAGKVATFCRARQAKSHQSETVPQVGVLFSKHSLYATSGKLFGSWGKWSDPARGVVDALLAAQYSVDVIPDWKALTGYPLVVVPDWLDIGAETQAAVRSYVEKGGKAIVIGAANTRLFARELGVAVEGDAVVEAAWIPGGEVFANLQGLWQGLTASKGVMAWRYADPDSKGPARPAAVMATFGQGQIAGICGPLGSVYAVHHTPAVRDLLARVVERLFQPMVRLKAPPVVEMAVRRKGGSLLVHLANMGGMAVSEQYPVIDFVPPVGPIEVTVRVAKRPSRVQWNGAAVESQWRDGGLHVKVERLEIHGIVEIV